jgi:hypothetical protein
VQAPLLRERSEKIASVTTAADAAPSVRAGGAMLVLLTLAFGHFLFADQAITRDGESASG